MRGVCGPQVKDPCSWKYLVVLPTILEKEVTGECFSHCLLKLLAIFHAKALDNFLFEV